MRKITDILSKEVVSVSEGEISGIVTNGYVDEKLTRIRGYKVSREEYDEPRALPFRRILGEGDALTVRDSSALEEFTGKECPLGRKVFDSMGNYLGLLRDLLFEEESGRISALLTETGEHSPTSVLRFGKNALLLRAPAHEKKVFRCRRGTPHKKAAVAPKDEGASSLAADALTFPAESTAEERAEEALTFIERKPREGSPKQDYTFLLGRKILRTVGPETDPIAYAEDIVTPEVLLKARERGKLVELTVNSKKA